MYSFFKFLFSFLNLYNDYAVHNIFWSFWEFAKRGFLNAIVGKWNTSMNVKSAQSIHTSILLHLSVCWDGEILNNYVKLESKVPFLAGYNFGVNKYWIIVNVDCFWCLWQACMLPNFQWQQKAVLNFTPKTGVNAS